MGYCQKVVDHNQRAVRSISQWTGVRDPGIKTFQTPEVEMEKTAVEYQNLSHFYLMAVATHSKDTTHLKITFTKLSSFSKRA